MEYTSDLQTRTFLLSQFSRSCGMRLQRGSPMLFQNLCVSLKSANSKVPAIPKAETNFASVLAEKKAPQFSTYLIKNNMNNMY